jgi:hypothetical protein
MIQWIAVKSALQIAALVAGSIGAIWFGTSIYNKVYYRGYNAAIAAIAAQDKEAVDAAEKARSLVRECNATDGMRWDTTRGLCTRR